MKNVVRLPTVKLTQTFGASGIYSFKSYGVCMRNMRLPITGHLLYQFTLIGILLLLISSQAYGRNPSYPLAGEQSNTVAYDVLSGDASNSNSYNNASMLSESFKPTKSNLDGVLLYLKKSGTPPDSYVTVTIQTSVAGFPSGSILAYSNLSTQNMVNMAWKWYYLRLNKSIRLSVGTTYHIVFNGTSHVNFAYSNPGTYPDGNYQYNFGGGWKNSPNYDIYLKTVTNEKGIFQTKIS